MNNSVVYYLEKMALKYPNEIAIRTEARQVNFSEYWEMAQKVGTYISEELKVFKSPIAVYMQKDERILETFMGILCSGNFYCPIPYDSPDERAKSMLSTISDAYMITTRGEYAKVLGWNIHKSRVVVLEDLLLKNEINVELLIETRKRTIDCDPAYLLFTSGSTNIPKGVVVPHRAIIDRIVWMSETFSIDKNSVLANQAPFHFDASMPDIFLNIIAGAKLVIPSPKLFSFPMDLLEKLKKEEVNTLIWVPSALVNLTYKDAIKKCILDKLKLVIFCGEVMHNKYLNKLRENYENVKFINMYGPTEATYACTYYEVDRNFADIEALPIGNACGNTAVFLIDNKGNLVCEKNKEGEICVRGSSLALGYYKKMKNTSFETNILQNEFYERVYRTGDIGKWNEYNELMYIGRMDNQIKHRGYRIELGEIEAAVQSIEGVNTACVTYNEENDKIVLFYESENAECDKQYIIKKLKPLIPKYMYPTVTIKVEAMPYNINGKIDRKRLKESVGEK